MLIYVIIFILIVAVALLVLKKRKDTEAQAASTAKTKKPSSARPTAQKTTAVEPVAKKEATPLPDDLRQKIEGLIQERNFFAAEAQINQALKKDNLQHDLYLLLLDIHILQKDEFAISQLINHLDSLGLESILAQAKSKKADFEQSSLQVESEKPSVATNDTLDFPSASMPTSESTIVAEPKPTPINDFAFDQLQQEIKTEKTPEPDVPALDFNFNSGTTTPKPTTVETPVEQAPSLDFKNFAPELKTEVEEAQKFDTSVPSFDFDSFKSEQTEAKTDIESPSISETQVPTLDFKLDLDATQSTQEAKLEAPATETPIQPLDFSFTEDKSTTEPAQNLNTAPSFDLNSVTTPEPVSEVAPTSGLDFKLDSITPQGTADVVTDAPSAPVVETDPNDPLVQSFPELASVSDAQLNLDLAAQYIQLGAYDAARELLAEKDSEYSSEQRQQADALLNKIAS